MNTYKDWHKLTERAGILHDKISDRIYNEGSHFCRHCAENGRYCGIADLSMEDKGKLIAIRDSLKDVQNVLQFVQALESQQQKYYNETLARLEESRMLLIEKVNRYSMWGTTLDVIEELRECLGGTAALSGKLVETSKEKQIEDKKCKDNSSSNFLVSCIRGLFNPWNWYRTTRIAAIALIVVSPVNFYRNRLQHENRMMPVPRIKIDNSDYKFSVSCGKG